MGSSKRQQLVVAAMSMVVGGLVVVPAAAFADREPSAAPPSAAPVDVGDALAAEAEKPHDHSTHDHAPVSTENSVAADAQDVANNGADLDQAVTLPSGLADVEVITGISEATTVALGPEGTAFVALNTRLVKSFDSDSTTGQFEGNATSTPSSAPGTGRDHDDVGYTYNRDPATAHRRSPGGAPSVRPTTSARRRRAPRRPARAAR